MVSSASGLVWSMNCESWLPPKNSFMAATTGRMLISALGVALSVSWIVMRSLTTRSMRSRPTRKAFWISSPLARMRRLPRWSMSSGLPWSPLLSSISWPTIAAMSSLLMVRSVEQGDAHPLGDGVQLLVDLVAADAAQVVAAEVEEQALDELLGVVTGGRIARAQLLVDLDQGLAARVGVVLLQRRGDVRRRRRCRRCGRAPTISSLFS